MSMRVRTNTRITKELVINGLKFIAENYQTMNYNQIIDDLRKIGCNFSIDDVIYSFPNNISSKSILQCMKDGDLIGGASIIANIMYPDNYNAWEYVCNMLLSNDSEYSIYNFIRVITGDNEYKMNSSKNK